MFKKHFRDLYLIGISFIAGVLFIVQCGGAANGVAQAIGDALGVDYNNSDSSLSATNLQDAIDELDVRFPLVFNNNEEAIGLFLDKTTAGWTVWSFALQTVLPLDPLTGEVITQDNSLKVHFSNGDCTGTPYLRFQDSSGSAQTSVIEVGGIYYAPNFRGTFLREGTTGLDGIQSTLTGENNSDVAICGEFSEGSCGFSGCGGSSSGGSSLVKGIYVNDTGNTFVEAREVSVPDFPAPLFLGTNT